MKTHRCRIVPALQYLARGLSICALLVAADGGSAWAGKPVDDGSKKSTPAPGSGPAPDSTARDSAPRAVSLVAYDKKGKPAGHAEGFFVSSTGIVATVRHLLTHAARVTGETPGGKHFAIGGILAADPIHDVVLLQTDAQKTAEFPRGDFQHIQVGAEVSIGDRGVPGKQAGGVILRSDDLVQGYHWLLIKGIASQGLGGSPVFSETGDLIGMIRDELKENAPGAAVSIESIDELLKRLPAQAAAKPVTDFKPRTYDEMLDDPDFREALSAIERKDFLTAATHMSRAAEQFPESAACRAFLGTFQTELKSWPAAEQSYKAAIKIDPDYALAWGYIGIPLYYEGKADEAIAACKKSIAMQRDNFGAWTNLGGIYIMQGNLTAASELIEQLKDFHTRAAYKIADRLSAGLDNAAAASSAKGAAQ
jgi:Flp pilus assembly protein TadD